MKSPENKTSDSTSLKAACNQPVGANGISVPSPHNKFLLQPKLTINQPNDVYEQEADSMADKVMRMNAADIQMKPLSFAGIQRKCAHCEAEEQMQRKKMNNTTVTTDNEFESYVGNLNSGGQNLPDNVRSFYEPRFNYDFSNVKVHTDTVAAKSAQSVNALAYTNGNNIVFNEGQYSPGTNNGKRLLAHELTHVVQQGNNNVVSSKLQSNSYKPSNDALSFETQENFIYSNSQQISRQEDTPASDTAVPEGTTATKSLRECINAGLSAYGLEVQVGYIAMAVCGIASVIAGIGTVEAGAVPGALTAAILCLSVSTGVEIGILTGIIINCVNNRNSY